MSLQLQGEGSGSATSIAKVHLCITVNYYSDKPPLEQTFRRLVAVELNFGLPPRGFLKGARSLGVGVRVLAGTVSCSRCYHPDPKDIQSPGP